MRSDLDLLEGCLGGDRRAGGELFRRHVASLYCFFHNKVGSDTEDMIQETFESFLRHARDVRCEGTLRPYLLRIARNKLFNLLRSRSRSPLTFDSAVDSVGDTTTSARTKLARSQVHAEMLTALRSLTIDAQIALELHYWDDLTNEQMAEVLEVPVGTVKSRLRRAKEALRAALARGVADGGKAPEAAAIDRWAGDFGHALHDEISRRQWNR